MLFYIHYMLMTSGLSGTSVLLAVFFKTYTDASQGEIGVLLMTFPFVCLVIKPLFCSMADRWQAHKRYMIIALIIELLGYSLFAIIPFFPQFYEPHPRMAWYILVLGCHLGNGGLGVAWSLGDCLAVNMSQKTGTPFGRMRLMGTVSWGVYGFIIGQINEVSYLPKYVPAFLILMASLFAELALIICWKNEDFEMVDPLQKAIEERNDQTVMDSKELKAIDERHSEFKKQQMNNFIDSLPSSLGGTLRLNTKMANIFRDEEDLQKRLKVVAKEDNDFRETYKSTGERMESMTKKDVVEDIETNVPQARKNPQLVLLKMILLADGRVIKYIILFTVFGYLMAPMNFVFLSMEEVCRKRGYNFSQLAGAVLISQASIETIAFLVVPMILCYISRSFLLSFGFLLMAVRFFFYAGWYYTADISPYWAVIGEWAHGISYGIFCIIQADVSLMFANQSRLFITELRKMGFLSDEKTISKEKIEAEERSIKMALRATMQALLNGFMDGLGQGTGALICGIFVELYSYISLWKMYWIVALGALIFHQVTELTHSRFSDTFKPKKGTKAYEIMQLANAIESNNPSTNVKDSPDNLKSAIEFSSNKSQKSSGKDEPAECC